MLFQPLKPMLLTMRQDAFDHDDYIFEPKYDGWHILLHKEGDHIDAFTRNGRRVTERFPEAKQVATQITADAAILDCEAVVFSDGRPVFDHISYRGHLLDQQKIQRAMSTHPVTFVAFDVLYADGECMNEPLMKRKAVLKSIVEPSDHLIETFYVDGQGIALKQAMEERKWEGIVAKCKHTIYRMDTRSTDWLKIKNWHEIDVVILGYRTAPQFGMVVGLNFATVSNKPVATVEFGFTPNDKAAFLQVAKDIRLACEKGIQWIEPRLCCRIKYLERTERHQLRIATFKWFLFDVKPEECKWVS